MDSNMERISILALNSFWILNLLNWMFKCVSFWLHGCCGEWDGWDPVNRFNHTSWVAIVTPTNRPKSVRNYYSCVCNRSFWWRFSVVTLSLGFVFECRDFCHRTESDILLFLLVIPSQIIYLILKMKLWYGTSSTITMQIIRCWVTLFGDRK